MLLVYRAAVVWRTVVLSYIRRNTGLRSLSEAYNDRDTVGGLLRPFGRAAGLVTLSRHIVAAASMKQSCRMKGFSWQPSAVFGRTLVDSSRQGWHVPGPCSRAAIVHAGDWETGLDNQCTSDDLREIMFLLTERAVFEILDLPRHSHDASRDVGQQASNEGEEKNTCWAISILSCGSHTIRFFGLLNCTISCDRTGSRTKLFDRSNYKYFGLVEARFRAEAPAHNTGT